MQVKIYMLRHPITKEIRYVGKTIQSLKKRLKDHIGFSKSNRKKGHCQNWILSLLKENLKPKIELIEECSEDIWEEREIYWITYYKNLTNISKGGNSIHGYNLSDEHKKKIGNSNQGKKWTIKQRLLFYEQRKGILLSDKHKKKISESLKGKKRPTEVKNKISNSHKGKKLSDETKEKLRQFNIGKIQSLEQRLKKSKGGVIQYSLDMEIIDEFLILGEIIEKYPTMSKGTISSACNGHIKTYKGFIWKYKKDIV